MAGRAHLGHCLIVDDHPLFCDALEFALGTLEPECKIQRASRFADAKSLLTREQPFDLVLLDLMLPDAQGLTALAVLRAELPYARLVLISAREEEGVVRSALSCGADAFLGKSQSMTQIVENLRLIMQGQRIFPPLKQPIDPLGGAQTAIAGLSPAQLRILIALADGRLNKQIAHDLQIAEPTVKSHLSSIFKKLGVSNRTQAVLVARQLLPS